MQLSAASVAYRQMLARFTGGESFAQEELIKPDAETILADENRRPELHLFSAKSMLFEAQKELVNASLKPTFGAFAKGYYGNPGLNPFNDMTNNNALSLNYIVGVKMQWKFGGYYTRKNKIRKLSIAQQQVDNQRDIFQFNTALKQSKEQVEIEKMQQVVKSDNQIIALRTSIRKAAEAKLENGTSNINDLLREITAENAAKQAQTAHEIELLKHIYDLKNTLNN